jgi:hypothetical protein
VRLAVVVNVVTSGVETDHPGIHVDTSGLGEGAFGGLLRTDDYVSRHSENAIYHSGLKHSLRAGSRLPQ